MEGSNAIMVIYAELEQPDSTQLRALFSQSCFQVEPVRELSRIEGICTCSVWPSSRPIETWDVSISSGTYGHWGTGSADFFSPGRYSSK